MLQKLRTFRQKISPGAVASALAHAMLVAVLIFGLPELPVNPEEPEIVQVQLVIPEEELFEALQQMSAQATPPPPDPEETAPVDQTDTQPIRTLLPVYRFGEEDAGPDESEDGDAADEAPIAEQAEEKAAAAEPPAPAETSETVRSVLDSGSTVTTTAKNDIPRGVRAGDLRATELRRQLLASFPPYRPNLLPSYRLDEGTLIQVQKGAFRSGAQWYDLKFRCEIDEDATKVVSFDFEVGAAIPRSAWAGRGLPTL